MLHRVNTRLDAAKLTKLANGAMFIEAPIFRSPDYERITCEWTRATHATCFSNLEGILDMLVLLESDPNLHEDFRALSDRWNTKKKKGSGYMTGVYFYLEENACPEGEDLCTTGR